MKHIVVAVAPKRPPHAGPDHERAKILTVASPITFRSLTFRGILHQSPAERCGKIATRDKLELAGIIVIMIALHLSKGRNNSCLAGDGHSAKLGRFWRAPIDSGSSALLAVIILIGTIAGHLMAVTIGLALFGVLTWAGVKFLRKQKVKY